MYEFHDIVVEPRGFSRRTNVLIGVAVAALLVLAGFAYLLWMLFHSPDIAPPKQKDVIVTIVVPPPPPPPKETPPPEEKMIEVKPTETVVDTPKPEDKPLPPAPDDAKDDTPPPGPLSLDAAPQGPSDIFNLGSNQGGRYTGLGGGGSGTPEGRFVKAMQDELHDAIVNNPKTKAMLGAIPVNIWVDERGHITKFELRGSSGSPEMDAAIGQVLAALTFSRTPPKSLPMPSHARITGSSSG